MAGRVRLDRGTGELRQLWCRRWRCPTCSGVLARRNRGRLELGVRVAQALGLGVQLFTLTSAPGVLPGDALSAWGQVRRGLAYAPGLREFAVVAQSDRRGWHLHGLLAGPPVPLDRLRALAVRANFGRVVDVRRVGGTAEDARRVATYLARSLARDGQRLGGLVRRLALTSYSRGWPRPERMEVSLTPARERLRAAQQKRRERVRDSHVHRRVLDVIGVAGEHGFGLVAQLDLAGRQSHPIGLRRVALMVAGACAPGRADASPATVRAAPAIRAAAGPELVSQGRAALAVAELGSDEFAAQLAASWPAWSADVVAIACALRPDLRHAWERARRARPAIDPDQHYPAWPHLDIDIDHDLDE